MLRKYVKRFLREEPTDKYYEDKDFLVGNARNMAKNAGEKKYRPKRAASSRAMETVHKAMLSDEEEVCLSQVIFCNDSVQPMCFKVHFAFFILWMFV